MEVANELKRLSLDINTVGFYDEAEEMEKMMNSLKEGLPIPKVCEYTGLSENQIARLV